ncbi:MAG: PatB family C-S lyase [Candidatus Faecousia sp.]|nr:PatB family C-S lyase [Clostridiales bacterium]MDD5883637.1 PatB family C-S lyase [Bacillota bacterium]MDY4599317.1 PatB family C-S lyase [Candidatus Faecousia sp.]
MKYNFDEIIDRSGNRSAKYDERAKKFGTADVIPLWVADMDFRTAQPIIDACVSKAEEGIWGYTSRPDSYFQAVQQWEQRRKGWTPDISLMSWSLGVVPSLSSLVKLFSRDGDKILIQTPVYSEFYDVAEAWGREVLENPLVETDGKWCIDFNDFAEKVKQCKIFLLCNPQNPVGRVWEPEELRKMAELCVESGTLLVSDEIHSDLIFHGKRHTPTASLSPEIAANTITCVSATKTFNLAGLQASTTIFPNKDMKRAFEEFWGRMDIRRNNAFSCVAMEAAYREGEEWLDQLLPYISGNFDYICDFCAKNIPQIKPNRPDATYLMWLDCRALSMTNEELRDFFIHKAKLGLNEGYTFGHSLAGFMRLNAACPRATLEKAMRQLKAAVDSL